MSEVSRMLNRLIRWTARVGEILFAGVSQYGWSSIFYMPAPQTTQQPGYDDAGTRADQPPPGHPERLVTGVTPQPTEQMLWDELERFMR